LDPTTGEEFSEKTVTFPYGDGYLVMPSVIDNGMQLSEDELYSYAKENGPYDFLTGERLPVHQDLESANKYAKWRSDNQFNEAILDENYWHRDAAMPFYTEDTLEPYRPTLRDNARNNIRDTLEDWGVSEGAAYRAAKGIAGEENPTDGGLGIGLMDFTPLGLPMGAQEARRDFNRASDNEDYVGMGLAGVDGALTVAEALPVGGPLVKAAGRGIRRGAEKLTEAALDPTTVGSLGGNLFSPRKTSNIDELVEDAPENALNIIGLDDTTREEWRALNKVDQKQRRVPQIQDAASALVNNEITSAEYRELVEGFQPIVPLDEVPALPTVEEIASALDTNKVNKGIVGVNKGIEDGTYVSSRLDIPAYENYDTWVVSLHDGTGDKLGGKSIGYAQTAVLNDVKFGTVPKAAANIASGKGKTTIARIFGKWENKDPEAVHELAQQYMDDPEWTQVGMNPFRHSYFYDKATGEPVVEATEVIQVGPLVLARGVKRASPDDPMFRINPKDENSKTFALGGLSLGDATKGITTQEGRKMAKKKFQLDPSKADANGDGDMTQLEKTQAEAEQKAAIEAGDVDLDVADEAVGMNCGGMMAPEEMLDPVSGNPVPLGSNPENVRDDIPAMLSQDEYVLPAHVVKWHGLKHIQE
jgi:hypothetical protein